MKSAIKYRVSYVYVLIMTLALLLGGPLENVQAAPISPLSYDMINGGNSSLSSSLRDDSYTGGTGNPAVPYSSLSGGLGDLTNGIVATGNWDTQPGPYVGWKDNVVPSPTITFHFDGLMDIGQVGIHMNSWYRPSTVDIIMGGTSLNFPVPYQGGHEWIYFSTSDLTGDTLLLRLNDDTTAWNKDWILISEVSFDGSPVPAPAAILLLGSGLAGLAGVRRKFRK